MQHVGAYQRTLTAHLDMIMRKTGTKAQDTKHKHTVNLQMHGKQQAKISASHTLLSLLLTNEK